MGNYVKSRLTPASDTTRVPASFIYGRMPALYDGRRWPPHGAAMASERDTIPARRRQLAGTNTCPCVDAGFTSVHGTDTRDHDRPVTVLTIDLRGRIVRPDTVQQPISSCRIGSVVYHLVP